MIDPQAEVLLAVELMPAPIDWAYAPVDEVTDVEEEWVEEEWVDEYADWTDEDWDAYWAEYDEYDDPYADWTDEDWEAYWAEYEDEYYDDPYADWTDEDWEAYYAEYEDYEDPYADWTDEDWDAYWAEYEDEYYDDPYAGWTDEDWEAYYAEYEYYADDDLGWVGIDPIEMGTWKAEDGSVVYLRGVDLDDQLDIRWTLTATTEASGTGTVITVAGNPDDEPAILACEDYPSPAELGTPALEIAATPYGDLALLATLLDPQDEWEPVPPTAADQDEVEFVASEEAVDEGPSAMPAIELAEVTNEAPIDSDTEADAPEAQLFAALRG